MILGTGVDIVETTRIEQALRRFGHRFRRRIYTEGEIAYCEQFRNCGERYAARFACKEAAFKALGTGWRGGIQWTDAEVRNRRGGRPTLLLHGAAYERANQLGVTRISLSISHGEQFAIAIVIFEGNEQTS
jgi:holo-[acyl-carrier protein] synthase